MPRDKPHHTSLRSAGGRHDPPRARRVAPTRAALLAVLDEWAEARTVAPGHRAQGVAVCTRLVERLGDARAGELLTAEPETLLLIMRDGRPLGRSTLAAYRSHVASFQRFLGGGLGPRRRSIPVEVTIPCGDTYVVVRHLPDPLTAVHVRQIAEGLRRWVRS